MYVIYYTIYVRSPTWFLQDRTNNLSRQAIAKRNVADDNNPNGDTHLGCFYNSHAADAGR
jgi:hypothetical protein